MTHDLRYYLRIAEILNWGNLPVEVTFPEIDLVLKDLVQDYYEGYDYYYCTMCGSFDDYLDVFINDLGVYMTLLCVHDLDPNDASFIKSFSKEINMSMQQGMSFIDALEDWDLIWP